MSRVGKFPKRKGLRTKNFGLKTRNYCLYLSYFYEREVIVLEKQIITQYQEGKSISQLLIEFPQYNRR